MDAAGNIYVADMKNQRIRMIRPDGYVLTLAGNGPAGPMMGGYVDGPASAVRFADPTGLCVAPDGSIYVADTDNQRIRRISPRGEVTTLAGSGASGLILGGYVDGPALQARFSRPYDVVMGDSGDLYVADFYNHAIRRIAPDGQVSTLVGSGVWGHKDGSGQAAELAYPNRIALDQLGNLYVTEGHSRDMYERRSGNRVRKIARDGIVTTVAGSGKPDYADGPATIAHMDTPMGLDVDSAGNIYVADYLNHCIRVVTPDGYVRTLAGIARLQGYRDGAADSALFSYPMDVLVNESERLLYVADVGNHRVRAITLP